MAKRATTFELALPPKDSAHPRLPLALLRPARRHPRRPPAPRRAPPGHARSRHAISPRRAAPSSTPSSNSNPKATCKPAPGSGTYVSNTLPDELLQVRSERQAAPLPQQNNTNSRRNFRLRKTRPPVPEFRASPQRAFRPNLPALDLFPTTLWAQVAARRLRKVSTNFLMGCDPLGYLPLRQAVADYLNTSRGVNCTPIKSPSSPAHRKPSTSSRASS